MPDRRHSVEHEETWLILAGFLLRPGFGAAMDEVRIDGLWRLRSHGLFFPGKRTKLQEYILWRRVAGGLSPERQEKVLASEIDKLRQQKNPPGELVRLAGSLERLGPEIKAELVDRFIASAVELMRAKSHVAHYLAALGLLLNRTPLYAGPETVVSPELVERAWRAFESFDWADPELAEMQTCFCAPPASSTTAPSTSPGLCASGSPTSWTTSAPPRSGRPGCAPSCRWSAPSAWASTVRRFHPA